MPLTNAPRAVKPSLRRHLHGLVGAVITVAGISQIAPAQSENVFPLRLVVPCAIGSPADLLARHVAANMLEEWDQLVQVENIPTGSGRVRNDSTGRWLADGRTIILNLGNCGNEGDGWWPAIPAYENDVLSPALSRRARQTRNPG